MSGTYITSLMMSLCGTMGLSIMASLAVWLGSVLSYHTKKHEEEKRLQKSGDGTSENDDNNEETDEDGTSENDNNVEETDEVEELAIQYISKRMCIIYFILSNVMMVGVYFKSQQTSEESSEELSYTLVQTISALMETISASKETISALKETISTLMETISTLKERLPETIMIMDLVRLCLPLGLGTKMITQPLKFLAGKLGYSMDGNYGTYFGYVLAILIYSLYLIYKHWIARNVIALFISCMVIRYLHFPNLSTAYLLLWSYLCYDYFWVFIINMMSKVVAVELPGKIVFPGGFLENNDLKFSLLGVGDIVLPGLFMALLYRIDHRHNTGSSCYFKWSLVSYVLGLIVSLVISKIYQAMQPALIFLVPACTLPPLILAAIRGELHIFRYDEIPTNSTNDSHNRTGDGQQARAQ